jgi:adenosylmethionine-8-amino-7-oxononanoate aminotransferase
LRLTNRFQGFRACASPLISTAVRRAGVLTRLITDNTLHISPPFVVAAEELQDAIGAIGQCLAEIERNI